MRAKRWSASARHWPPARAGGHPHERPQRLAQRGSRVRGGGLRARQVLAARPANSDRICPTSARRCDALGFAALRPERRRRNLAWHAGGRQELCRGQRLMSAGGPGGALWLRRNQAAARRARAVRCGRLQPEPKHPPFLSSCPSQSTAPLASRWVTTPARLQPSQVAPTKARGTEPSYLLHRYTRILASQAPSKAHG